MEGNGLRGILIAVVFVFVFGVGYTSLTRAMPSEWMYPIQPPFNVLVTLIPIAVITFFVARFISIHPAVFGAIAFGVTLFVIAVVFEFRGHDDSLDVPVLFALVETIAYLVGFVGHAIRLRLTQQEQGI